MPYLVDIDPCGFEAQELYARPNFRIVETVDVNITNLLNFRVLLFH
jgi:hypothetical protein